MYYKNKQEQKLEKHHWDEWEKQYAHPGLTDKDFRHPAFKSHSNVLISKNSAKYII